LRKKVSVPRPTAWQAEVDRDVIEVLPLAVDGGGDRAPGWCAYVYSHPDAPEVEVFSGGINSKTVEAAGLWRQGNLLHFGFDLSPKEMNETGKNLLINSIHYIARFQQDRPITRVVSPFKGLALRHRSVILRAMAKDLGTDYLKHFVAPDLLDAIGSMDRGKVEDWFAEWGDYLRAGDDGKLVIDEEARALGAGPRTEAFFQRALAGLDQDGEPAERARRLLARYAPEGPGQNAPSTEWRKWYQEHRPYLFFSDSGGFRWYVDPLAKSRGVPSIELRGLARADVAGETQ
jgi:hypothetical protein